MDTATYLTVREKDERILQLEEELMQARAALVVEAGKKSEQSELRFRNLVEKAPSPICILKGKDMVLDVANEQVFKIWNVGKETIGKPFLEIIPEMKDQPFMGWLQDVFKNGVTHYGNEQPAYFIRKNGERDLAYFNFVYQPYHENDGTVSGVMVLATDVTEQVLARKKTEESEKRFRLLADSIPIHVFIMEPDEDVSINYWNKSWLDYTGQTIEEALGKTWNHIIHPNDIQTVMDTYRSAFEKRQSFMLPGIRVKRYDGMYRWHSVTANPRYLPSGDFIGYIGIGVDIHESKLTEDALKVSESHFRKMTDLMPAKISNANADGDVTYFNKHWLDFSGMDFKELKEFGYHQIMHPDEIAEFQQRFQKAAETGEDMEMEMRFKNAAGNYKWHLNIASPVKDEHGRIKMWVGVTTEIQKMKDEEERKGDFIKMVSHELKTPVTSIKGYVQTLLMMLDDEEETVSPEQIKSSLVRIDKQVLNLTRLISEMLDLTRIEAGILQFKMELFSLNTLINETAGDILIVQPKYSIELFHDCYVSIFADRDRIGQVLINFINNAIKYSPTKNKIEIHIYKTGNGKVSVSVKDFGIGISKGEQQKIFERFYRVGGSNEQTFPGFGIGLFIASSIIQKHHGTISINSEKGKGSEFIFELNIAQENN